MRARRLQGPPRHHITSAPPAPFRFTCVRILANRKFPADGTGNGILGGDLIDGFRGSNVFNAIDHIYEHLYLSDATGCSLGLERAYDLWIEQRCVFGGLDNVPNYLSSAEGVKFLSS